MTGSMCSRTVGKMNSWLQTACQPNSFWYGTTRSSMKRLPRSVVLRAAMISPAVSCLKAADRIGVGLGLLLHLPEGLDRVPVAVLGRVLEPAEERLVDLAVGLLHDGPQVERRGELGEVEHPVDLPVPVVDVDRVLEQARPAAARFSLSCLVELALEVVEVALHLRDEALVPPRRELVAVDRQDGAQVRADLGRVLVVLRHDRTWSCEPYSCESTEGLRPAWAGMAAVYR